MGSNKNIFPAVYSILKTIITILLIFSHLPISAQIVFTRDTTLTGDHTFAQTVRVYDSTVTVTIEGANLFLEGGITIEDGTLFVRASNLYFYHGSGLVVKTNGELYANLQSKFYGQDAPGYFTLLNSKADIYNCDFNNVKIFTSGRPWWISNDTWAYRISNCDLYLMSNNPDPIFNGNRFEILNSNFWRQDTSGITVGQYYNISMAGQYGKVENCYINMGGINAPWNTNRNLEIINNRIFNTNVGIRFWGVSKIEGNWIENVETGITGGTSLSRVSNVLIRNNYIANVSDRAINLTGDSLTIHNNILTGNRETGKGILFGLCSGSITNNLISDFKITAASYNDKGIALHVFNPQYRDIEISGNIFEHCGLSDFADPGIISSIVYLESPVIFIGNELRFNTLGGIAATVPVHQFPGGPVLDIAMPYNSVTPVVVNNNLIHSNTFVNEGVYEPTGTRGTLVGIKLENKKLEFSGNTLDGSPDASLGIAMFPLSFPNGIVGDSLVFEQNTIMNNKVGIGTVAAPDLSGYNNFKNNADYHIMRYWSQRDQEMFAQNNNWDSGDPDVIDNMLFDNEEDLNNGPINFNGSYNITYDVTPTNPSPQQLIQGDSLEITVKVTDSQGNPISNMPVYFSSNNAKTAKVIIDNPFTGNDGYITGMLHAYDDSTTEIRVFAGGSISDPIQINVGTTAIENEQTNNGPDDFYLNQNYPNPFNPTTTIKYQLPRNVKSETANVKLMIYDLLGREVAQLVNEKQKPGNYEVVWDASQLTSGVYFYRLNAGAFIETRKMILIR